MEAKSWTKMPGKNYGAEQRGEEKKCEKRERERKEAREKRRVFEKGEGARAMGERKLNSPSVVSSLVQSEVQCHCCLRGAREEREREIYS